MLDPLFIKLIFKKARALLISKTLFVLSPLYLLRNSYTIDNSPVFPL